MDETIGKLEIYSARFTIYRDKIHEETKTKGIIQVKYRPVKKGKQKKRILPLSEISINGLVWGKTKIWPAQTKEVVAKYERFKGEDGYRYRDVNGETISTSLTQKLDNLIYESFDDPR